MDNKYKRLALSQKRGLPLEQKIILTEKRIREWYDYWGGQVYLSFSGGKDSTVLKHIIDHMQGVDISAVFIDTGLEYPEVRTFAMNQPKVSVIKPKMSFRQVLEIYGYPVISKKIADTVEYAKPHNVRWQMLQGTYCDISTGKKSKYNYEKWRGLLNAPFKISNKCCAVMKKNPAKEYTKKTGKKPILALLAGESSEREKAYIQTGCNAFDKKDPQSQPMGFWTEQDVLSYLAKFNVPYASVYGEIKQDGKGKYYTTGCARTGCIFCMFGCHLEKKPNRFQLLKESHPKLYDYCMKPKEKGGLGLDEVLNFINVEH